MKPIEDMTIHSKLSANGLTVTDLTPSILPTFRSIFFTQDWHVIPSTLNDAFVPELIISFEKKIWKDFVWKRVLRFCRKKHKNNVISKPHIIKREECDTARVYFSQQIIFGIHSDLILSLSTRKCPHSNRIISPFFLSFQSGIYFSMQRRRRFIVMYNHLLMANVRDFYIFKSWSPVWKKYHAQRFEKRLRRRIG